MALVICYVHGNTSIAVVLFGMWMAVLNRCLMQLRMTLWHFQQKDLTQLISQQTPASALGAEEVKANMIPCTLEFLESVDGPWRPQSIGNARLAKQSYLSETETILSRSANASLQRRQADGGDLIRELPS